MNTYNFICNLFNYQSPSAHVRLFLPTTFVPWTALVYLELGEGLASQTYNTKEYASIQDLPSSLLEWLLKKKYLPVLKDPLKERPYSSFFHEEDIQIHWTAQTVESRNNSYKLLTNLLFAYKRN